MGTAAATLGFDSTAEELIAIWEANARKWPFAGPPWRPSPGDIAIYRRLIDSQAKDRVVLFGLTPELRNLLASFGVRPVIVDLSAAMHEATSQFLREAKPADETWIQADWCQSGVSPGTVDLLLGDMLWWGLSLPKQVALRDVIHALLGRDGLFVGRIRFTDTTRAAQDPVAAVRAFLERLDNEDAGLVRGAMLSWLYDHTENRARRTLDRARTRDLLLTFAERPEFAGHREFLTTAATLLIGADWTSQSRDELLEIVGERFEVVEESRAGDYDSESYPIFALRPI